MFVDPVGFTELSERLEPAVLVRGLNGYYQCMSDAIHDHRGQVGCYFGALQPNPWQCGDAVHAALAMREASRTYNVELHRDGLPALSIGIGIHRGSGLVDILVTDALRADLDTNFALIPMAATHVKGFAEPVVTYAVKGVNTHGRQDR
jgi:adenylate cyclase